MTAWPVREQLELEQAIESRQRALVRQLTRRMCDALQTQGRVLAADRAKRIMQELRHKRFFDEMLMVGDALVQQGDDTSPLVLTQYAQALIERGSLLAAQRVLESLLPRVADDEEGAAQVSGILGRVHKQRYVLCSAAPKDVRSAMLKQALSCYYGTYKRSKGKRTWHGINAVALLARAQRDGIKLPKAPAHQALARRILATVRALDPKECDEFARATAAEALLALGETAQALEELNAFVLAESVDAFECNSTLRQLREIWQLEEEADEGALLSLLRAALLTKSGGRLEVGPGELGVLSKNAAASHDSLQKTFGNAHPQLATWYERALLRARAVARVEDTLGQGVGTGFLVRARDLGLEHDEPVLVTNAHVLGATSGRALRLNGARVSFERLNGPQPVFEATRILFESPLEELDTTVVSLSARLDDVEPLVLSPDDEPEFDAQSPRRLYAIGHPGGYGLALSLEDSLQIGWRRPRIHYRTPTERGSSGSPVFDEQWRLVGIHHAGGERMPRLDGEGVYQANEALWIHQICRQIRDRQGLSLPPQAVTSAERPSVVLLHCTVDQAWAKLLFEALTKLRADARIVSLDLTTLPDGRTGDELLLQTLPNALTTLLLVTPALLRSRLVRNEKLASVLKMHAKRKLLRAVIVSDARLSQTLLREVPLANDPEWPLDTHGGTELSSALEEIARGVFVR